MVKLDVYKRQGYKTVTVGYRAGETLRVRLEESRESLEEVTVVAYGEQRRGQVSGSVATVDAARLQNKPASNVLTLAKGQLAGVYIASQSGDPGGNDVSIIVRGANDLAIAGNRNPLFVIDGVIASDDASLKAVSYTHLDVYKRQTHVCVYVCMYVRNA